MQDDDRRRMQPCDEVDDLAAVLAAVDPELVLNNDDVELVERRGCSCAGGGRAADELSRYLRRVPHDAEPVHAGDNPDAIARTR